MVEKCATGKREYSEVLMAMNIDGSEIIEHDDQLNPCR
jgi:hypothetical protein